MEHAGNPLRVQWPDRARRMSDVLTQTLTDHGAEAWQKWMAFRFEDGRSDGVLYALKSEAIRHQSFESQCAYVCVPPGGMTPQECDSYLRVHEEFYRAGLRVSDPDTYAPHMEAPIRRESWKQSGLIIPRSSPRNLRRF